MELRIENIKKSYKNQIAVNNISTTMTNGVYGLLGANGAGKTTLMRIMCGVLNADSGTVSFGNDDVSCENYRDCLGYLPQDFGYYPNFTAMDFLLYIACLKGIPKDKAKKKSKELLEIVSLQDVQKKKIKAFSGGMRQRLGIAQAMLNDPKILILDEPTAGLDPKERVRFRNLISTLAKDRIILLSTHIVSDIESIAKKILVMKSGEIIHEGTIEELISIIDSKVYECTVNNKKAEEIIATLPVVNLRNDGNNTFLRVVCDTPPDPDAIKVDATLEDLYLYYFNEV